MNPRQRRGVLLLAVTAVGAVAVFLAVLVLVSDVQSKVGDTTEVLTLADDVDAYEPLSAAMLEPVEVPRRWLPDTAVVDAGDVVGLVAAADYSSGSMLQRGMFVPRPGLQEGYREVAIVVDAETGVAGKVGPGDHVDILATTAASDTAPARAEVWVSDALVLEVGVPEELADVDALGNLSEGQGVPVTFALPVTDALRVAYAESFAVKVRLALRGAGDATTAGEAERVFTGAQGVPS